jgi:hypothetical protein
MLLKAGALLRQLIDGRGFGIGMPVAAEIGIAQVIAEEEHDIRLLRCRKTKAVNNQQSYIDYSCISHFHAPGIFNGFPRG